MGKLIKNESKESILPLAIVLFICIAAVLSVGYFAIIGSIPHDAGKIVFNVSSTDMDYFEILSSDMTVYQWDYGNEYSVIKINYEFSELKPGKTVSCDEVTFTGTWPNKYPRVSNCVEVK
jgi:hypothetical protein